MAERLPGGTYRYNKPGSLPAYTSNGLNHSSSNDITVSPDFNGAHSHGYQFNSISTLSDADSNGTISPAVGNGCSSINKQRSISLNQVRLIDDSNSLFQAQSIDEAPRSGNRAIVENEHEQETEWVEQDEPGVYITLTTLPGGGKDLKRVRFSRKRFSEKQAEQWWTENRARVYEQYNVRIADKSRMCPLTSGRLECIDKV